MTTYCAPTLVELGTVAEMTQIIANKIGLSSDLININVLGVPVNVTVPITGIPVVGGS